MLSFSSIGTRVRLIFLFSAFAPLNFFRDQNLIALHNVPRIDDLSAEIGKVFHISGGELRAARDDDARNLRIADINHPALALAVSCQHCSCFRCRAIKIQYAPLQILD